MWTRTCNSKRSQSNFWKQIYENYRIYKHIFFFFVRVLIHSNFKYCFSQICVSNIISFFSRTSLKWSIHVGDYYKPRLSCYKNLNFITKLISVFTGYSNEKSKHLSSRSRAEIILIAPLLQNKTVFV